MLHAMLFGEDAVGKRRFRRPKSGVIRLQNCANSPTGDTKDTGETGMIIYMPCPLAVLGARSQMIA